MRQVFDMLVTHDPENPLIQTLKAAKILVRRGVVEQIYNIGFGILKDTLEGEEDPIGEPTEAEINAAPPFLQPIPDPEEEEEDAAEEGSDQAPRRRYKRRLNRPRFNYQTRR